MDIIFFTRFQEKTRDFYLAFFLHRIDRKNKQNSIQHKSNPMSFCTFFFFIGPQKTTLDTTNSRRKLLTKTVSFTRKKPLLLLLSSAATSPKHTHATNHIVCRVDVLFTVYCVQTSIFTVPRPAIIKRIVWVSDGSVFRVSKIRVFLFESSME